MLVVVAMKAAVCRRPPRWRRYGSCCSHRLHLLFWLLVARIHCTRRSHTSHASTFNKGVALAEQPTNIQEALLIKLLLTGTLIAYLRSFLGVEEFKGPVDFKLPSSAKQSPAPLPHALPAPYQKRTAFCDPRVFQYERNVITLSLRRRIQREYHAPFQNHPRSELVHG